MSWHSPGNNFCIKVYVLRAPCSRMNFREELCNSRFIHGSFYVRRSMFSVSFLHNSRCFLFGEGSWPRPWRRRSVRPTVCISMSTVPSCRIGRECVRIDTFAYTNGHVSDRRSFGELCRTYSELTTGCLLRVCARALCLHPWAHEYEQIADPNCIAARLTRVASVPTP